MKFFPLILFICITFSNSIQSQTFTRISTGPLVSTAGDSRSVNWVDVNNDGWLDCFITNGPTGGQNNMLYLNDGTGNFNAVSNDTIVHDNAPSDGATFSDLDNDGDLDCFVVNWYNVDNLLYTNDGNGNFTRITTGAIVNDAGYSETASWGDYDNDGFNDLYVTNSAGNFRNFLYHNSGVGTFSKILTGTPVTDQFNSRSVNWTDIDGDGDLDLFVTNENNQDENLYRNDGGGTFTRLADSTLLSNAGNTMNGSWGDYDNDGDLDVFLCNDGGNNALFRNEGSFQFTKISSDTVSNSNAHSFSSAWSDIDNDGDLDLFVTNGFFNPTLLLNFLYTNNGDGSFTRVNNTTPATDSSWSYGCAFGDYDNDGFEDLAVATVRFNGIDPPDLLYHNDGNSNSWITIRLVGTTTNKSAIGTKIRLKATINGNPVWQLRELSAQSSYCGQNDLRAHFGIGSASVIDSIVVEWLDGTTEYFTTVSTNQFITITEAGGITKIKNMELDGKVSVFPNPAQDVLNIRFAQEMNEKIDYEIIDNAGAIIVSGTLQKNTIPIKKLRSGTYFLVLKGSQQFSRVKFIKSN